MKVIRNCAPALVLGGAASMLAAPLDAAIRCGTQLISEGDSALELLEACGEPAVGDRTLYIGTTEWTYNFGPNEFMQRVLIRDGEVERIEELDHGFEEPVEEQPRD